jgi:glutathione S-transferase
MAPHFILEHVNAIYELVLVDRKSNAHKSHDYIALNPSGRIPALSHNNSIVLESSAISIYVAENHPDYELVPHRSDLNRGAFLQWKAYLTNTLQNEIMLFEYARRHCESDSSADEIKSIQEQRIVECLKIVDRQLAGREYLLGGQLTVCDFYLFMLSVWADELKEPPLSFDNISRYLKSLAKLNSVSTVCEKEGLSLDIYR